MNILYVKYSLWKSIVQNGSIPVYEKTISSTQVQVWAGERDVCYRSDIKDADYSDYISTFSNIYYVDSEDEALANIIGLSTTTIPRTEDGRQVVLTAQFQQNIDPYFAGCDDDGNLFLINWTIPPLFAEDKFMEWSFHDWLYISRAAITYRNASIGDYVSSKVIAKATNVTSNGGGTGNCNKVPSGLGFNIIVPATGNGAWDVLPQDMIPVPSLIPGQGYWSWDEPDTGKGTVSPQPGGNYNLYDADIDLIRWFRKIPLIGSGPTCGPVVLDPETKPRKVLPHWTIQVQVHNASMSAIELSWHLTCARKKTT